MNGTIPVAAKAMGLVALLCAGCGGGGGGPLAPREEPVVEVGMTVQLTDAGLLQAIAEALDKSADQVTEDDLRRLESLTARDRAIADLGGIEALANLDFLNLSANQIEDIGPLAALDKLTTLVLDDNQIGDLAPLASLSRLQVLAFENNAVRNLAPLLGLGALAVVRAEGNPLDGDSTDVQLAALRARGVEVVVMAEAPVEAPVEPGAGLAPPGLEGVPLLIETRRNADDFVFDLFALDVRRGSAQKVNQSDYYGGGSAAFSADGSQVVYSDGGRILVAEADGSVERALSGPGIVSNIRSPVLFPDGGKVLTWALHGGVWGIFTLVVDGDWERIVTRGAMNIESFLPSIFGPISWSADGARFYFTVADGRRLRVFSARDDGSDLIELSAELGSAWGPVPAPDGGRVLFYGSGAEGAGIYASDAAGGTPAKLVDVQGTFFDNGVMSWSPAGDRVAYSSIHEGARQIFAMDAGGGNVVQLTHDAFADRFRPLWSPDGSVIAFNTWQSDQADVWLMDAGGGGAVNLTASERDDFLIAWSPRP